MKDLDPITQSAGQLHYINKAVTQGMDGINESRKLVVGYEEFCKNPWTVFDRLVEKLGIEKSARRFCDPAQFRPTRDANLPNRAAIEKALAAFESENG